MIFKDEYRQTIDEIKTDDALLEKILTQTAQKKPPLYRQRLIHTVSAAAASVIIISTGILTLPKLMQALNPAQDQDYMASFIENDDTSSKNHTDAKDGGAAPFTPPVSASPSPASEKNAAHSDGHKRLQDASSPSPAAKSYPKKAENTPNDAAAAGRQTEKTTVPKTKAPAAGYSDQSESAPASTPVPTTAPFLPENPARPTVLPDIQESSSGASISNTDNSSLEHEDLYVADIPADTDAGQQIKLHINRQPPAIPENNLENAPGGGSSGGGSGSSAAAAPRLEIRSIDDYCGYLGIDVPGKVILPNGMTLLSGEPSLLYSGETLIHDHFSFLYQGEGRSVSIDTSKLDGQEVKTVLSSPDYEKSDINGTAAVIMENQGSYTVYLYYAGVSFIITSEGLTQEELSVLLVSLTV